MSFVDDEENATVGRMPYETDAANTTIAAPRGLHARAQADAPPTWTPPIIPGLEPRVATQADIDRLLRIEGKYQRLVRALKDSDVL